MKLTFFISALLFLCFSAANHVFSYNSQTDCYSPENTFTDKAGLAAGNKFLQANLKNFPEMFDLALNRTKPIFSNADDRVICEEVWIEVPIDIDGDGKRDLIRARFRRPIETKPENGGLKTPVIAQLTPYAGTFVNFARPFGGQVDSDYPSKDNPDTRHNRFEDIRYKGPRYKDLLAKNFGDLSEFGIPTARVPKASQAEGAPTANWRPTDWHAYFIHLGYTCASLEIVGSTYGEGFLTFGSYEENLCAASLVDWLNGRLPGYSNPTDLIEVKAPYWATGDVAMSGVSYNGTLPFAAAITGVEGLRTIIPIAPVSSSYEYYRANGGVYSPGGWQGEDVTMIINFCFGRGFSGYNANPPSPASPVFPSQQVWERYYDYLNESFEKQDRRTGDYSAWWDIRNQAAFGDNARKDLGIIMIHGFNDDNVKFKQTALIHDMCKKYGITCKGIFHQGMHTSVTNHNGLNFYLDIHKWFDYYLYGVVNGMPDDFPNIRVQSNIDITWKNYDTWPTGIYQKFYPSATGNIGQLSKEAPKQSAVAKFKDEFILNLKRPEQPIPPPPAWDALYTVNATKHSGHVVQMSGDQYSRWRNYMLGGNDNTAAWTAHWTAPDSGVTFNLSKQINDRLLYVIDVTDDMIISGTIKMTAKIAANKNVGAISAMLIDVGNERRYGSRTAVTDTVIGPHGQRVNLISWSRNTNPTPARIISRGSVDVQNPNFDGKIWTDCFDTHWMAPYTYQTTTIEPGKFYPYTWELDVMDYTVLAGHQLVLMLYGSDPEYTLRPYNPTEFTVETGPETYLSLPLAPPNK